MIDLLKRQRDKILPSPDVLRSRSEIGQELVEIDQRHFEVVSRFASTVIDDNPVKEKQRTIKDELDRVVGTRYWFDTLTADGIDRGTTAYVPDENIRSGYPFSLLMDAAYMTGLEGHNDRIAEIFMKELGVTIVVVGPEFSADKPKLIGAETKLGKIACLSATVSLSKHGEASAFIYDHLRTTHPHLELSENVGGVGESRAAMIEEIRRLYTHLLGLNPVYSDITDPVINEQALTSAKNALQLFSWPVLEGPGALAVGLALLKKGDLHREIDTVPASLRYGVGALVGSGPALLSGEEGEFHNTTPLGHPQHIVNMRGNTIADTEMRMRKYGHHYLTDNVILRGSHIGLGYPSVQGHVVDRYHSLGTQLLVVGDQIGKVNWDRVHMKDKGDMLINPDLEKTAS